jgi:hypothetical protein
MMRRFYKPVNNVISHTRPPSSLRPEALAVNYEAIDL